MRTHKLVVGGDALQDHADAFREERRNPGFALSRFDVVRQLLRPLYATGLCVSIVRDVVHMALPYALAL